MTGRARNTRRLRSAILKGSRRTPAPIPLEPMVPSTAIRHVDELDSLWQSITPCPHACSISSNHYKSIENKDNDHELANVLRNLEEEFSNKGLFYAAAAACCAQRKLRCTSAEFDFHPALWPHIRKHESTQLPSA